jgi:hypothetical protein
MPGAASPVPAKTPWWSSGWLIGLIVFALAWLGFVSRRPDQWGSPQFWAEDGSVFFRDAIAVGWRSLWQPYAGYLHVVPRIVACLTKSLPWEILPRIYMTAALLIAVGVVVRVALARLPMLERTLAATALVAVPHSGEVFLNLTNLHWILDFLLVVNLLETAPARAGETFRRMTEVLIAGLSGPMVVLLAPFAGFWAWRHWKSGKAGPLIATWIGVTLLQGLVLLVSKRPLQSNPGDIIGSLHWVVPHYTAAWMLGKWMTFSVALGWLTTGAGALAVILLLFDRSSINRIDGALLIAVGMVALVSARLAGQYWPNPFGDGARYVYAPFAAVMWAFAAFASGTHRPMFRGLCLSMYALAVWSSLSVWKAPPLSAPDWSQQVREARAGLRTQFEVAPGMSFPVPTNSPRAP